MKRFICLIFCLLTFPFASPIWAMEEKEDDTSPSALAKLIPELPLEPRVKQNFTQEIFRVRKFHWEEAFAFSKKYPKFAKFLQNVSDEKELATACSDLTFVDPEVFAHLPRGDSQKLETIVKALLKGNIVIHCPKFGFVGTPPWERFYTEYAHLQTPPTISSVCVHPHTSPYDLNHGVYAIVNEGLRTEFSWHLSFLIDEDGGYDNRKFTLLHKSVSWWRDPETGHNLPRRMRAILDQKCVQSLASFGFFVTQNEAAKFVTQLIGNKSNCFQEIGGVFPEDISSIIVEYAGDLCTEVVTSSLFFRPLPQVELARACRSRILWQKLISGLSHHKILIQMWDNSVWVAPRYLMKIWDLLEGEGAAARAQDLHFLNVADQKALWITSRNKPLKGACPRTTEGVLNLEYIPLCQLTDKDGNACPEARQTFDALGTVERTHLEASLQGLRAQEAASLERLNETTHNQESLRHVLPLFSINSAPRAIPGPPLLCNLTDENGGARHAAIALLQQHASRILLSLSGMLTIWKVEEETRQSRYQQIKDLIALEEKMLTYFRLPPLPLFSTAAPAVMHIDSSAAAAADDSVAATDDQPCSQAKRPRTLE